MSQVPALPGAIELSAAVSEVFAPEDARACPARVRNASGAAPDGRCGRRRLCRRRHPPRRGRDRHGQDAGLPGPRHSQPATRPDFHGHEKSAGTDLFQGPTRSARIAGDRFQRHVHEGTGELSVSAPLRRPAQRGRAGGVSFVRHECRRGASAAIDRTLGWEARKPAIAPRSKSCRRTCPSGKRFRRAPRTASAPTVRATTTVSSP